MFFLYLAASSIFKYTPNFSDALFNTLFEKVFFFYYKYNYYGHSRLFLSCIILKKIKIRFFYSNAENVFFSYYKITKKEQLSHEDLLGIFKTS